MELLDASALLATLNAEPAGSEVTVLLRTGDAAISGANLAEAVDVLVRRHAVPEATLRTILDPVLESSLAVVPVDEAVAWLAASIRSRRYHRTRSPLSLGDCLLLASARVHGGRVHSSDRALIAAARDEQLEVLPLPDSQGRRPA